MVFSLERLRLLLYLHDHAYELRQGSDLHFFHHPGTMNFDSALTDIEVTRYDFIGFALNNKLHDLFFAWRQFFNPFFNFPSFEQRVGGEFLIGRGYSGNRKGRVT